MKTSKNKIKSLMLALVLSVAAISAASARVCFLPDSTDCGDGDVVGGGDVIIPCKYKTAGEVPLNSAYQEPYKSGMCYYARCKISQSTCEANNGKNKRCCKFDKDSGCYYMGDCPKEECPADYIYSTEQAADRKSLMNCSCDSCPTDASKWKCTCPEECSKIEPVGTYTDKCDESQIPHIAEGIIGSNGQCYTCKSKQPDPDDNPNCYDTVVTIECLGFTRDGGCNYQCADEKCTKTRNNDVEFADGRVYSKKDIIYQGTEGKVYTQYICRMTAEGKYADSVQRFYYQHYNPDSDSEYHPCEIGQACAIYSDVDYQKQFKIQYNDVITGENKTRTLNQPTISNDFTIVFNLKDVDGLKVEPSNQNIYKASCDNNKYYQRNIPEIDVCEESQTCKDINPNYYNIDDANNGNYECNLEGDILYSLMETGKTGSDGACYECRYITCNEFDSEWGNSELKCPTGYVLVQPHDDPEYGTDGQCFQCAIDTTTCKDLNPHYVGPNEECSVRHPGTGKYLLKGTTTSEGQCYDCIKTNFDIDIEYCPSNVELHIAYRDEKGKIVKKSFEKSKKKNPDMSVPYTDEYFIAVSAEGYQLYQLTIDLDGYSGDYMCLSDNNDDASEAYINERRICKVYGTTNGGHFEYKGELLWFSPVYEGFSTIVEPVNAGAGAQFRLKPYCQTYADVNMGSERCAFGWKGGGTICGTVWVDY